VLVQANAYAPVTVTVVVTANGSAPILVEMEPLAGGASASPFGLLLLGAVAAIAVGAALLVVIVRRRAPADPPAPRWELPDDDELPSDPSEDVPEGLDPPTEEVRAIEDDEPLT